MLQRARTEGRLFQNLKWPKDAELVLSSGIYSSFLFIWQLTILLYQLSRANVLNTLAESSSQ